jgi:hypothetical protein
VAVAVTVLRPEDALAPAAELAAAEAGGASEEAYREAA